MVRAAWVQCRAFPHELQPEPISRACRVIPLQICGVSAPKKRTAEAVNAGGTAEGMPFVPILWDDRRYFFVVNLFRRNEYERTIRAY